MVLFKNTYAWNEAVILCPSVCPCICVCMALFISTSGKKFQLRKSQVPHNKSCHLSFVVSLIVCPRICQHLQTLLLLLSPWKSLGFQQCRILRFESRQRFRKIRRQWRRRIHSRGLVYDDTIDKEINTQYFCTWIILMYILSEPAASARDNSFKRRLLSLRASTDRRALECILYYSVHQSRRIQRSCRRRNPPHQSRRTRRRSR